MRKISLKRLLKAYDVLTFEIEELERIPDTIYIPPRVEALRDVRKIIGILLADTANHRYNKGFINKNKKNINKH